METTENNGSNELIKVEAKGVGVYEPRSYDEAMRLAVGYANSGLLGGLKSAEAVFLVMATGAELGIPPTAALRSVHIVQGKPVLSADLIVALCLRSSLCEYFTCIETTGERATYETKRKGAGPVRNTFAMEDAKRAGLSGKDNYKNYGATMLRHRASAELARMVYPDLVLGIYAEEEISEVTQSMPIATAPKPQDVIEGEVVEPEALEKAVERWTKAFSEARTKEDCDKIVVEIVARKLEKGSDTYKSLREADKTARERIAGNVIK